jgi:hypothetical protein
MESHIGGDGVQASSASSATGEAEARRGDGVWWRPEARRGDGVRRRPVTRALPPIRWLSGAMHHPESKRIHPVYLV